MKKTFFAVVVLMFSAFVASAADRMPNGENIFLLGYPEYGSTAYSVSGGAIYDAAPFSISLNPALTAALQRPALDLGYNIFVDTNDDDLDLDPSHAIHLGGLYPTNIGVWTLAFQTVLGKQSENNYSVLSGLGDMFYGRIAWSRDVTDFLYVGASVYAGTIDVSDLDGDEDYAIAGDVGFVFRVQELAFLKDFRFSGVLANIGKTFDPSDGALNYYPQFLTVRAGIAAVLVDVEDKFKLGLSADATLPAFINLTFSAGLQAEILNMLTISGGWDMNVWELAEIEKPVHGPFVSIAYKHKFNTGSTTSDFKFAGGWQQLDNSIQSISVGLAAKIGREDDEAPEIEMGVSE
ncbi:MAG: hypothetical protein Ta2B_01670 [Termitinemataceae bacterium]|nr:MAG: hypothetical protein Ta2B_01670 [Termitinemataceae bacterium]